MKKHLLLKTLLMAVCLGGGTFAWGDVIETVGNKDKSSPVGTHSNTTIVLKKGETKIIRFNNYGSTGQSYYNWTIVAKEGNTEKFSVRADVYDNTSKAATNYEDWRYRVSTTRGGDKSMLDWGTFPSDMQNASCLAAITYGTDGTLSLRATSECSTGRIYYHGHDVSGLSGADVNIILYVDHSYLEITEITSAIGLVGAIDYTNGYATVWNESSKIWINPGEKAYYKIKNYNKGDGVAALYNNWCVWAATESSINDVIFCHNHSNTATNATYVSKPELTVADLDGATVELTAELTDAGNGTYTYTCTAVTTKADGTVVSPNLVYQQTGLTSSKYKMYVSPDAGWLAVLESAVKKNITSAGYATYFSSNALDFANATPSLTASLITGTVGETTTLNLVDVDDVPAATGVLLAGDEATYTIPVIASSSTNVSANKLEGVNVNTEIAAEAGYVLMNEAAGIGFYKNSNAFTVGANTAYLPANFAAGSRMVFFGFEDATGINEALSTKSEDSAGDPVYNLNGQRVSKPEKGLYIVNGKKVIKR